MPPFDEVADLINVHTVRTASVDSGISGYPGQNVQKKTFYGVTGHFDMPGFPTTPAEFMGTHSPETVWAAAERIAPLETLELFIVLVNLTTTAACCFPEQQLAFSSLHETNANLVNYVGPRGLPWHRPHRRGVPGLRWPASGEDLPQPGHRSRTARGHGLVEVPGQAE